jgi:nicotinamide-nucleotide amidase
MESRRTGACVAVGSELLGEDRLDSNSLLITRTLAKYGVQMVEKRVVGDSVDKIAEAIRELMGRVDMVVVTGGLGPTSDDVTREAVAKAMDRELAHDAEVEEWVRQRYAACGRVMPEIARRMARVVRGARSLPNSRGAAQGMLISSEGRMLAVLPGVPWEMEEMLRLEVEPELELWAHGVRRVSRSLLLGGVYESEIEERIEPLYGSLGRENVTILAKCGVVRIVLSAEGEEAAALRRVTEMEAALCELLGDDVAGVNVLNLEQVVLGELQRSGSTLAAAESCTGGLLSARITDVPGASAVFLGGVVSYSNDVKERVVGVPRELLVAHGAVSEPVARAMASGVRDEFGAGWGLAITGIAGPTGGTEEKPVGLVHWAVAGPGGVTAMDRVFPGDRPTVRLWSVHSALDMLRRRLVEERP